MAAKLESHRAFFRPGRKFRGHPGARAGGWREGIVLLLIALLFVANVLLYLFHHYGLTSIDDLRLHSSSGVSAQIVQLDRG